MSGACRRGSGSVILNLDSFYSLLERRGRTVKVVTSDLPLHFLTLPALALSCKASQFAPALYNLHNSFAFFSLGGFREPLQVILCLCKSFFPAYVEPMDDSRDSHEGSGSRIAVTP